MTPNIAVVVLDSLRYDYFQRFFEWVPGTRFENAYSTSHWTVPAHGSLFTGKYPSEAGVHAKAPDFDVEEETLVESLRNEGYTTRCYTANPTLVVWGQCEQEFSEVLPPARLDRKSDLKIDWSEFSRESKKKGHKKFVEAVRWCVEKNTPTLQALREGIRYWRQGTHQRDIGTIIDRISETDFGSKEFLFLNVMEPHTPYDVPGTTEKFNVVIGEALSGNVENPEQLREAYRKVTGQLSEDYRNLYENLAADFDYIITLSDHGEMLGEEGMWNHGYGLYPELTHIPLVIDGPGFEDISVKTPVNLIDLHETLAGLASARSYSKGRDLSEDSIPTKALVTEFHGLLPWHQDQLARNGIGEEQFEQLNQIAHGLVTAQGKYAFEHPDGTIQSPDEMKEEEVQTKIDQLVNSLEIRADSGDRAKVDEDVKKRLRELGYA